ncbi:MAG: M48 family metalloprotease [Candidatus Omnitrophica bacterium]|nr:M48 family metalloprotease [Candidatus Omnitrophota bacterium]
MIGEEWFWEYPFWIRMGWSLFHFVWQGAILTVLFAVILCFFMKHSSSNGRYIAGCLCLILMSFCPVFTYFYINTPDQDLYLSDAMDKWLTLFSGDFFSDSSGSNISHAGGIKGAANQRQSYFAFNYDRFLFSVQPYLPFFVIVWISGVMLLTLRLLIQWIQLKKLCKRCTAPLSNCCDVICRNLSKRMHIERMVHFFESANLETPFTIGWLKPVVLIPASAIAGLSPEQMEAILAHELAHIKRCDYLVNIFQTVITTLLFYHPGVWWISRRVRMEREHCCDDYAIRIGTPVETYVCALADLEKIRHKNLSFAMSAQNGSLLKRISRLVNRRVNPDQLNHSRSYSSSISIVLIMAVCLLLHLWITVPEAMSHHGRWVLIDQEKERWNKPAERSFHSMVYDSRRHVIVLHGGVASEGIFDDTWEYDGEAWRRVAINGPRCYAHKMAYDARRGVTVLCGGRETLCNEVCNDGTQHILHPWTWEWDGRSWKKVNDDSSNQRIIPGMAYDPARQKIIRHGGALDDSYRVFSDTSEWDGRTWTQIAEGPQRWDHEMVYDSCRNNIVMFGGYESRGVTPQDTWVFDGKSWERVAVEGPVGRCGHCFAFDPSRGVAVLFGGFIHPMQGSPFMKVYNDMWEWDGNVWRRLKISFKPTTTFFADMTFDAGREKIVFFGGIQDFENQVCKSDTWEFSASKSKSQITKN